MFSPCSCLVPASVLTLSCALSICSYLFPPMYMCVCVRRHAFGKFEHCSRNSGNTGTSGGNR